MRIYLYLYRRHWLNLGQTFSIFLLKLSNIMRSLYILKGLEPMQRKFVG